MCGHGGTVTRRWFTQFVPAGRSSAAGGRGGRSSGEGAVTCKTPWPAAAQTARYLPPFHQNTTTRTVKQSCQGDFHNTSARAFIRAC